MPRGEQPSGQSLRLRSWGDAEAEVVAWLRRLGHGDVTRTSSGADGGVDLVGRHLVGQVKTQRTPVSAPLVQALNGVAAADGKQPVFFALAGYTPQAIAFANRAGLALFTLDDVADPRPLNESARALLSAPSEGVHTDRAAEEALERHVLDQLQGGPAHIGYTFGDYLAYAVTVEADPLLPIVELRLEVEWRPGEWPVAITNPDHSRGL